MQWCTISIPPASGGGKADELRIAWGKHLFIGRQLYERGLAGWQTATTAALLAAWDLAESPVFFDVGANIGIYALLHAHLWPGGVSVAFEPTPAVADYGEAIAAANGLAVRWERAAVSDADGEATLYLSHRTDASNSLVKGHRRAKDSVTVPTVTLDGYCASSGLTPSVVKIDVERHEPAVLRGASRLLTEYRPVVVTEILPGHPESDEIQRLISDQGYESRRLVSSGPTTGAERDWLFWPGAIPAGFDTRFHEWISEIIS